MFIRADLSRICIRLVAHMYRYCLEQPNSQTHRYHGTFPIQPSHPSISIDINLLVFSFMNAQSFLRFVVCCYECQYLLGITYMYSTGDIYYALYLLLFRGCSYGTYSIVHTTISQVVCLSTYIDIGPHYGKATVLAVLSLSKCSVFPTFCTRASFGTV